MPVAEPGYLGYLSNAISALVTNVPYFGTAPAKAAEAVEKPPRKIVLKASRSEITRQTQALVRKLLFADTDSSRLLRIRQLTEHIQAYPPTRLSAVQEPNFVSLLLSLEADPAAEPNLRAEARLCLRLCGHVSPTHSRGINLLCIDGGGTRGMMGLEVLEALEVAAGGRKIHELFDHVVGVSTGSIIAVMLGVKKMSACECKQVYMELSRKLFSQGRFAGTTGLLLSHSYYNTAKWVAILQEVLGEGSLADSARDPLVPCISIVSSIVNLPVLQPYIFRNYEHPAGRDSHYRGGMADPLWKAVQASAAAPGYFEEVKLGESTLLQDGGVIANNPTAIGVHEAKTLRPRDQLHCVVSVGNGRSVQELEPTPLYTSSRAHHKLLKIIDSATDTEAVHCSMHDLLNEKVYYRLNPYMSHAYGLDEIGPERLECMATDSKLYVRRNQQKIEAAAERLLLPPTPTQRVQRRLDELRRLYGWH